MPTVQIITNRLNLALVLCVVSVLTGCVSPIPLLQPTSQTSATISLQDLRPVEQRQSVKVVGILTPMNYLGDSELSASPVNVFSKHLERELPSGNYSLAINSFRIADIFPRRAQLAVSAGLAGALSSMGIAVMGQPVLEDTDSIACATSGILQNQSFAYSQVIPYKLPAFGKIFIREEAVFAEAVNNCIHSLASGVAAQYKNSMK